MVATTSANDEDIVRTSLFALYRWYKAHHYLKPSGARQSLLQKDRPKSWRLQRIALILVHLADRSMLTRPTKELALEMLALLSQKAEGQIPLETDIHQVL
jgi:hypothetical protein